MKQTTKIIIISMLALLILTSFVFAIDKGIIPIPQPIINWFDAGTPSQKLDIAITDKLIQSDYSKWESNQYWKDGNCYYFDLKIGYDTTIWNNDTQQDEPFYNVTWSDSRRELQCTDKQLDDKTINQLELDNIQWTLEQLGATQQDVTPIEKVDAIKGENLVDATITDATGTALDRVTMKPIINPILEPPIGEVLIK